MNISLQTETFQTIILVYHKSPHLKRNYVYSAVTTKNFASVSQKTIKESYNLSISVMMQAFSKNIFNKMNICIQ